MTHPARTRRPRLLRSRCRTALLGLLLGLVTADPGLAQASEEEQIRAVRSRSNTAIVERDLETLSTTWHPDLQVTTSSGLAVTDGQAMLELFARAFEEPQLVGWVRTPETITLSQGGTFASESGTWTGRWNLEDGTKVVTGTYLAQWQKRDQGWRIRAEVFVALNCQGNASACEGLP